MMKPKSKVPNLSLPLVNGTQWHLDAKITKYSPY